MKNLVRCMMIAGLLIAGTGAYAAVNVTINIGNEPPPQIVMVAQPEFIAPPSLGFYVAVGIPYDIFFINTRYYLHHGNTWYLSSNYDGPWMIVREYRQLPWGLRKYKYDRMILIRDNDYKIYQSDRAHYKGKHMVPAKRKPLAEAKPERTEGQNRGNEGNGRGNSGRSHGNH